MAPALNRNRILIGKFVLPLAFLLCLFTASYWPDDLIIHEINDFIGILLIFVCIAGRMYSTLFIGGRKNAELITEGPYSIVRNPLYLFSFLGVLGIGFYSNHLVVLALLAGVFLTVYQGVIHREEAFLETQFGEVYRRYKTRVPMLVPDLSLYRSARQVEINLTFVHKALKDAIWWLVPIFLFEVIEYLHGMDIITPLILLP